MIELFNVNLFLFLSYLIDPTYHCCNKLELKLQNDVKNKFGNMAGIYSKKKSENINGHNVWKQDGYNYDKNLISYQAGKGWLIGPKVTNSDIVGIYGPSGYSIHCPALVGNEWKYTPSKKNIHTESEKIDGGKDITLKCLGKYQSVSKVSFLQF